MKKREPVSKIMTKNVVTINLKADLLAVEKLFKQHHIRHLPVVSGEKIVGILSLTDLLRLSFADSYIDNESDIDTAVFNMLSVEQVMVKNVKTIEASKTIREAAEMLSQQEFHALPVTENDKLVGIITTTDLIKYLLEQY